MLRQVILSLVLCFICQAALADKRFDDVFMRDMQDDPQAQYDLGVMYYRGNVVQRDYQQAIKWFTKAAEQQHIEAINYLGYMHNHGQGVERNEDQSIAWYTRSADLGNAEAQFVLGHIYLMRADYKTAMEWFSKSAAQGNPGALYRMGDMFSHGRGVARDFKQAMIWYTKAAEAGDADAQHLLGFEYSESRRGTVPDYRQAIFWYTKAALQGNTSAQKRLGLIHFKCRAFISFAEKSLSEEDSCDALSRNYALSYVWLSIAPEENTPRKNDCCQKPTLDEVASKLSLEELEDAKKEIFRLQKLIDQNKAEAKSKIIYTTKF